MWVSTFRKLRTYTRYSHSPSLRFLCTNTILQASRQHALSLLSSKLAADMCYHIAPACGRHASPPSSKLAATLRRKYLPSAPLSEANMRQHHLSSSRPTCASLPCNILLRRMPCTCRARGFFADDSAPSPAASLTASRTLPGPRHGRPLLHLDLPAAPPRRHGIHVRSRPRTTYTTPVAGVPAAGAGDPHLPPSHTPA
jgi:hypothetical protein